MRIAETIWHTDEGGAEASLVERLEAQVEALTAKVGRLERRQHRFTEMIRLLLELHDKTAARLSALGLDDPESEDALSPVVGEITRVAAPAPVMARRSSGRLAARRSDG